MPAIDPEDSFVNDAMRRARERLAQAGPGDAILRSDRVSLFDVLDARTLVAVAIAVVAVALVDLNATRIPNPFDALDLALRMVAFTCVVRACLLVVDGVRRGREKHRLRDQALVLLDDALVVSGTHSDAIPRDAIVAAGGASRLDGRPSVVVVHRSSRRSPVVPIPIASELAPDAVARRIERFRAESDGATPDEPVPQLPAPSRDPAADFARIVSSPGVGETAIPVGYGWLRRGPFAASAFVVVFVERALFSMRTYDVVTVGVPALAIGVVCLAVPLVWLGFGFARIRAMGGAALVATPAELLARTRAGMHRVPWTAVESITVTSRRGFTMLGGAAIDRRLVIDRLDGTAITFDEAILGEPADVVRVILEAYCDGAGVPPSQGTGGGGGISGLSGTTT